MLPASAPILRNYCRKLQLVQNKITTILVFWIFFSDWNDDLPDSWDFQSEPKFKSTNNILLFWEVEPTVGKKWRMFKQYGSPEQNRKLGNGIGGRKTSLVQEMVSISIGFELAWL